MQVSVGDKVIYSKYAGTEVKLDGEEFIVVRQNDIVAKVEDQYGEGYASVDLTSQVLDLQKEFGNYVCALLDKNCLM